MFKIAGGVTIATRSTWKLGPKTSIILFVHLFAIHYRTQLMHNYWSNLSIITDKSDRLRKHTYVSFAHGSTRFTFPFAHARYVNFTLNERKYLLHMAGLQTSTEHVILLSSRNVLSRFLIYWNLL